MKERRDDMEFRPAPSRSDKLFEQSDDMGFRPAPKPNSSPREPEEVVVIGSSRSSLESRAVDSSRSNKSARSNTRSQAPQGPMWLQFLCTSRPKWIDAIDDFLQPPEVKEEPKDPLLLPSQTHQIITGCVTVEGCAVDLAVLHDAVQQTMEDIAHVAEVAEVGSPVVTITKRRPAGGTLLDCSTHVYRVEIQVPDQISAGRIYTTLEKVQDESDELLSSLTTHFHRAGVSPPQGVAFALDAVDIEQFHPDLYYFHEES